ncbi:hypothetical protein, partial [Desulfolucanica intricata]|uniref:hypothetical protein n=1 Tax=Desulfolucanica intricata TaxID=1285191 RepID=UPI000832DB5D
SGQQTFETSNTIVTEQDVRNAVTELINGLNSGNIEVVSKYVAAARPVAEQLVEKFKNNIKLYDVRDISIEGNTAQATVTLEIVPLQVKKDISLNFDVTDVLLLNNPLGLLSIFFKYFSQ